MNNCLMCKYSKINGIFGDMECKFKNHICERLNDVEFTGKIQVDDKISICEDGVVIGTA